MERLYDYLPNAIALIYVIDSSKAGGFENSEWVSILLVTYILILFLHFYIETERNEFLEMFVHI